MKKLLFSTAFMLFCLCSYSQPEFTVHNDSDYAITVWGTYATASNCAAGGDTDFILPGDVGTLTGAVLLPVQEYWMIFEQ